MYARDFGGALFSYFDGQYFENFTGGARLKAVFDNPVTAVSVTFGVGGAFQIVGWSGLLLAFDAADVQIDSQTMDFTTDGSYLLQVSGNIKSITATFPAPIGNSTPLDFAGLTRIEAVPEPATWISGIALLGACMALVAQHRMQK